MAEDNSLRELWQEEGPAITSRLDDLRAEEKRRKRGMLLVVAGEVLLTLGLVAITIAVLSGEGQPTPETRLWAGLAWTSWLILVVFAVWNRRGVWTADTESARSFIALSEERARRRVRAASFMFGFTVLLGVVFVLLGWLGTATGAVVLLYLGGALWYGRRARRELAAIRRIAAEFDAEAGCERRRPGDPAG